MQVVMVMFRADGERRSFSLTRDLTVIGRREDCDLRIPLGDVSRKHCRIVRDGETVRLEDLGSSNGTFVNGQRVQEATLNAGDTIQVGPVVFCVQIDGVPSEEDMTPIFTSPQTPEYEEPDSEPLDAVAAHAVADDGVSGAEGSIEELAGGEADLAIAEEPFAEASGAPLEMPADAASETTAEDVFVEDETAAAQADIMGEPGEAGDEIEAAAEGDEVQLEEFDIIDSEDEDQSSESGDAHADSNRH